MNVGEARSIAVRCAEELIAGSAGEVRGALLAGSTIELSAGEVFPPSSDVDVWLFVPRVEQLRDRVVRYERDGITVEIGHLATERLGSPEAVLGHFGLCPNVASGQIVFDPGGLLARLRAPVALAMAERRWVRQRCRSARDAALALLRPFERSESLAHVNAVICWALRCLGQMPLVADLQNPAGKKALVLARDVLAAYGLAEEHAGLLRLFGAEALGDEAILAAAAHCGRAVEEAGRWVRTPFMGDCHLSALSRVALERVVPAGVAAGVGRELLPWIGFVHAHAMIALQNDAPPAEAAVCREDYLADLALLGSASLEGARARLQACFPALERMVALCDDIATRNARAVG